MATDLLLPRAELLLSLEPTAGYDAERGVRSHLPRDAALQPQLGCAHCAVLQTGTLISEYMDVRCSSPFCRSAGAVCLLLSVSALMAAEPSTVPAAETLLPASDVSPDDVYAVAIGHYADGRWQLAADEFSRFCQRYPSHPQAATGLFFAPSLWSSRGSTRKPAKQFLDFLQREPNHRYAGQARFRVAETMYLTGDPEAARLELERFVRSNPDENLNAQAKVYLADLALSAQDGRRAETLFKEILERYPENAQVDQSRFGLGRALELQGEIDSARIAYQTLAAAGGPLADDAQVQMGICLYNRGKYAEAETAFQAAIARFPDSDLLPQARYWLGMSQVARHDWDKAAATLQAALDQYPQHALAPAMAFWRAEACRQGGDLPAARQGYEQVLQNWPDSQWAGDSLHVQVQLALDAAQYDRVVSLSEQYLEQFPKGPRRPQVEQCLGRGYLKLNRFGPAIDVLNRLVENTLAANADAAASQGDASPAASATTANEALALQTSQYYLALAQLGSGQHEAALEILAKMQVSPEDRDLYGGVQLARAMALAGLNRQAEAIEPLRQYLATQPAGKDAAACRTQLLRVLTEENRLDEAMKIHSEMSGQKSEQPEYGEVTRKLAEALFAAGKHDEALRVFGLLVQDGQPPELAAQGWAGLGWAHFRAGKMDAAATAFGRLVERYPESPMAAEAAMMKAKSRDQSGRSEEALQDYQLVATKYGDSAHAASALLDAARLQEMLGRGAEAIPLLRRLVSEHPEFKQLDGALYQLAWLLSDEGQADEAASLFQRIADEYPTSDYWADATYRLAQRAASARQYERAKLLAGQLTSANCPPDILAYALFLRGQLAASAQRWQEVADSMQELLRQFPDSPLCGTADYWIAEACFQQKEYEKAAGRFAKLEPDKLLGEQAWGAVIALRRAQILAEQQKWREAYELAGGIEDRFPKFVRQYEVDYLLGRCLSQAAQTAAAIQRFERVIRSPEGGSTETAAVAQWMIGEAYAAQGDLEQALKAYSRVESLYSYPLWKAAALLQAGKCHELKGESGDAADAWRQVLAKYRETPYATEAEERLEQLNARLGAAAPATAHVASPAPQGTPGSERRKATSRP